MSVEPEELARASLALTERAAAAGWRGADPYDGLWFPWPAPLRGGRRRRQAIAQAHARAPLDVRRLYRRRHPLIPKALGVFGSAGVRLHALTGDERARALALEALELLSADTTSGDRAWGYHWDVQTRWSFYPAGAPNVVVTAFAAAALLEAGAREGRDDLAARGRRAAEWVLEELFKEHDGYFAYHQAADVNVHNANLLGAAIVHEACGADAGAADRVARATERSLAAQRPDGSFPYGEGRGLEWADSFHTGFVLTCLVRLRDVDPARIDEALASGARYYERFFDERGRAQLWPDRPYPEDGHSAGTGLTTLATLSRRDLVGSDLLERVGRRVLDAGIRDGHAVFRRYRWGRSRVAYIRWCDAHVALGLADAALALAGKFLHARPDTD